jgi:hypothetical protein
MIGGDVCNEKVPPGMLVGDGQLLSHGDREFLWRVFVAIGNTWKNVRYESSNLKSSWLEMLAAKTGVAPSYTAEYINAVRVVRELIGMYGEAEAFRKLFFDNQLPKAAKPADPPPPPATRLAHAKKYVIDEFIIMQVMASGFKHFGGKNYAGYVKGSRYNEIPLVREYVPPIAGEK